MRNPMSTATGSAPNLPVIGAALRSVIIFITVLTIPLAAAQGLELSARETSSWILALYAVPGLLSLLFAIHYSQPLLITGNIFTTIFIAGLGGSLGYPELVGASILAGAAVVVAGMLGLTERLAALIPVPIVFGLLAGAILSSFVAPVFTTLGEAPAMVGGALLAYLVSRRFLGVGVPAELPAALVGLVITATMGQFEQPNVPLSLSLPMLTLPTFSLPAIITVTPPFFVLITLQANLPSVRFLQGEDYDPPEAVIDVVSGIGTILGSLLGPMGVSLSLPATSLVAGPGAGEHEMRYRSVYLAGGALLITGLLSGIATGLAARVPLALLLTLAGLSLLNVLGQAVKRITQGPLFLGPLFAFVVAISDMHLLGLSNYFWALVIGTGVSLVLEQEGLRLLQGDNG